MPNYQRLFIENSYVFITIVTNKRRKILTSNIKLLREAIKKSQAQYSYELFAIVILPEHLHMLIKPKNIDEYPKIITSIKKNFSQALPLEI
jgi:putative transposase